MVQGIPQPQARELLPPLLACLPTSFVSPRPPPALLPLLSPILRQRVQLLSASSSSWLSLLCWDANRAQKLSGIVENISLEPHPVSGEVEIEDIKEIQYRRLDPETLHARLDIEEFGLLAIFLWCVTDEASGGNAWRIAELRAGDDKEDGTEWFDSMSEADEGAASRAKTNGSANAYFNRPAQEPTPPAETEEDDDDYWASYDRTPSRTPAKRSPAPVHGSSIQLPTTSELEYFARYAAEVQPAMDPHDPDEEMPEAGTSTLDGNTISRGFEQQPDAGHLAESFTVPEPESDRLPLRETMEMAHPRPRGSSSSSRSSVEHLERVASKPANSEAAELAIKQHISSEIKSLYRLARNAGIQRDEFERTVRNDLDCLGLLELD